MASRKKKSKKPRSSSELFEHARRAYGKRDFKQALKDAKVCYRQEKTAEHRAFLEQAFASRANELMQMGMRQEGTSVVENLLELGVTDAQVREQLPEIMLALGMSAATGGPQLTGLSPEARERVLIAAADRAVVKSQSAVDGELKAGLAAIRSALKAVDENDAQRAIEALNPISRNSPFADWKLFIRGLIAYFDNNREVMLANWSRLNPDRAAVTIARQLQELDTLAADRNAVASSEAASRLERAALGSSAWNHLAQLSRAMLTAQGSRVLASLREGRLEFRKLDPAQRDRLSTAVVNWSIRADDESTLLGLPSALDPPLLDPRWKRASALRGEMDSDFSHEDIIESWQDYLQDLADSPHLSDKEKRISQALVWKRIGSIYRTEAEGFKEEYLVDPDEDDPYYAGSMAFLQTLRTEAMESFEKCVELEPTMVAGYEELADAQYCWGRPDASIQTLKRLLDHVPDHFDALQTVGGYEIQQGDPISGRDHLLRAQRLRPLDDTINSQVWAAHTTVARECAKHRKWDEGRQELAAARAADTKKKFELETLVRAAVFEYKAKNLARGDGLVAQAREIVEEDAPLYLMLAAEATKYKLPKRYRTDFDRELRAAIKKRCSSRTAGRLARHIDAYVTTKSEYAEFGKHIKIVLSYLKRTTRTKYRADDLIDVCLCFETLKDKTLLHKFCRSGLKKFPHEAFFHYLEGEREYNRGPFACNRKYARTCFERVLEYAPNSSRPEASEWQSMAEERLSFLKDVGEMNASEMFGRLDDADSTSFNPFTQFREMIDEMANEFGMSPHEIVDKMMDEMKAQNRL